MYNFCNSRQHIFNGRASSSVIYVVWVPHISPKNRNLFLVHAAESLVVRQQQPAYKSWRLLAIHMLGMNHLMSAFEFASSTPHDMSIEVNGKRHNFRRGAYNVQNSSFCAWPTCILINQSFLEYIIRGAHWGFMWIFLRAHWPIYPIRVVQVMMNVDVDIDMLQWRVSWRIIDHGKLYISSIKFPGHWERCWWQNNQLEVRFIPDSTMLQLGEKWS